MKNDFTISTALTLNKERISCLTKTHKGTDKKKINTTWPTTS